MVDFQLSLLRGHLARALAIQASKAIELNDMTCNKWRRTDICGEIAPDDWTLLDPSGESLARLYKVSGGPQDGRWYWSVLFRQDGSVGSGGTGFAATGREAREACESRVPENEVIDEAWQSSPSW